MNIPKDMIPGSIHETKFNGKLKILEYKGALNVRAMFVDTGYEILSTSPNIRSGNTKDKMKPTMFGVGFMGGDYYKCDRKGIEQKCYDTWRNMLARCYSDRSSITHPSYAECEVCEEWQNYQIFAEWFHSNYPGDGDWHIDKDIKNPGNKIYSPENCGFVSATDNIMEMNERTNMRWVKLKSPQGEIFDVLNVSEFCRNNGLSQARMSNLINGNQTHHKGWTLA